MNVLVFNLVNAASLAFIIVGAGLSSDWPKAAMVGGFSMLIANLITLACLTRRD